VLHQHGNPSHRLPVAGLLGSRWYNIGNSCARNVIEAVGDALGVTEGEQEALLVTLVGQRFRINLGGSIAVQVNSTGGGTESLNNIHGVVVETFALSLGINPLAASSKQTGNIVLLPLNCDVPVLAIIRSKVASLDTGTASGGESSINSVVVTMGTFEFTSTMSDAVDNIVHLEETTAELRSSGKRNKRE